MKTRIAFWFVFCCLILSINFLSAQTTPKRSLTFNAVFGIAKLNLENTYYYSNLGDSIMIETFKFYISGIELLNNDKIAWKEENSFHLIDASDKKTLNIPLNYPSGIIFNKIKLNVGIDSTTNVSGALGGDLDPTKGMYWTWQNGYINFKLEGKCNLCKTRNNEFQFHLGGYQYPFSTIQTITLNTNPNEELNIVLDLEKFAKPLDLTKQTHIMSPGKDAVELSGNISKIFSIQK